MSWSIDGVPLGALGLAGISREIISVAIYRPPSFIFMAGMVITLTLCLLANVAICRALFLDALASTDVGAGFGRLAANWAPFFLVEGAFMLANVSQWVGAAAFFVFSVAPRYGVVDDRDARSIACDLRTVPKFFAKFLVAIFRDSRSAARLIRDSSKIVWRLTATCVDAFLLILGYTALFCAAAWLAHPLLVAAVAPGEGSGAELPRGALLLGGAVYVAGAAHIAAVWRVTCVMLVVDDDWGFSGLHMSDELLTGRFWTSAAVLWTLEGCALAVQVAFGALVVVDGMGIGVWLRLAAGMVMAVALWAAVMVGTVAQIVVYFVCKSNYIENLDGTAARNLANVGRTGRASRRRQ